MTPEDRAFELWGAVGARADTGRLIAQTIRTAENDALERAANVAQHADVGRESIAAQSYIARAIRDIKHPDTV